MSGSKQGDQISPVMSELSSYIAATPRRKLPAEVAERAKIHLVDTFAALVSGSRLLPGKRAIDYVGAQGARREAGVVGTRIVTSAPHAALANGIFGHADETDDVHPPSHSHPGNSIVPATLAMAERQESSGEQMLRAMVLGYDINARVLFAVKYQQLTKVGFHCGSKGAYSAAARRAAHCSGWMHARYVICFHTAPSRRLDSAPTSAPPSISRKRTSVAA